MPVFGWEDWVGNLCYLILAGSYLVTNMYWLRVLAVIALGLECAYFYVSAQDALWVGIAWNVAFVSINLVQLAIMTRNRMKVRLSLEEQGLHRTRFARLDPVSFDRLARSGAWLDLPAGTVLAREGRPVECVYLLTRGSATVDSEGRAIAVLQPGSFAGEMSFLSGEPAAATVTTQGECRVFAVRQERLRELLQAHEEIAVVLQELFGYDLVQKLRVISHAEK